MDKNVKNKKAALYTFLEIVIIIIMTLVGNMWDWVNMSFKPEAVMTGVFWQETMVKSILYSGSLILGILLKLSKLELKDSRYDNLYGQYRGKLPFKDAHKKEFEYYVDRELNPYIKKEYLRTKLRSRLAKIQKHERDKWVLDYFAAKELENPEEYLFSSWFSKHYFLKRFRVEQQLDDDFIEKHYEQMSVKYPRISASVFGFYLEIKRNRDEKWKVNNEVVKSTAKSGLLKIISVFFVSAALTIFALQPSTNALLEQANGWIVIMIQYIVRVAMICISFATGVWTAKRSFIENYLLPLQNRIDILGDFEIWYDRHPVQEKGVEAVKQEVSTEIEEKLKQEYEAKFEEAKKQILTQAEKMIADIEKKQTRGAIN